MPGNQYFLTLLNCLSSVLSASEISAFCGFSFIMALFRGAVSEYLSVTKLHCLLTSFLSSSSGERDVHWSSGFGR